MNPLVSWRKPLAVCDFSEEFVRVAHMHAIAKKPYWQLLGLGECKTDGYEGGRLLCVMDLAESLWTANRLASKQSHCSIQRLHMSLDDGHLESIKVRGSAYLDSASEAFGPKHVAEAKLKALQTLQPQDKHIVYQKEAGFMIDHKDFISNPLGVVGKELTVVLQLLLSNSNFAQELKHIAERAGLRVANLYPSALASAYGILSEREMGERRTLCLVRKYIAHLITVEHEAIQEYKSYAMSGQAEQDAAALAPHLHTSSTHAISVTGEGSSNEGWRQSLRALDTSPLQWNDEHQDTKSLANDKFGVLAGLFFLSQNQKRPVVMGLQVANEFVSEAKAQVQSFLKEYF